MADAFGNTNPNQFGNLNFTDWSQVGDMFGPSVVAALQQNNVPLNQVGSTMGKLGIAQQVGGQGGSQFGAANPQFISSGFTLADAINMQQGGGGPQTPTIQQAPTGPGGPNAPLSNLGAAALQGAGFGAMYGATPVYNPTPASQPNPQSGVGQIQGPTYGTPLSPQALAAMQQPGQPLGIYTPGGGFNPKVVNAPLNMRTLPATPTPVYGGVTNPTAPQTQPTFGAINQPALYGQQGGVRPLVPPAAPGNFMAPNAPRPGLSVRNYTAGAVNVSPPNPTPNPLQIGPPNPVGAGLTAGQTNPLSSTPTPPAAPGGGTGMGWNPYSGMTATGQPMSQTQKGMYGLAAGIGGIGSALTGAFQGAAQAHAQGAAAIAALKSGIPNPSQFQQPSTQSGAINPYNPFNERFA